MWGWLQKHFLGKNMGDANLIAEMKTVHAKKFREGSIKQATFLKTFQNEIFKLQSMGYKPSEIKDFLENKLEVKIKMNSFYAWLNYVKSDASSSQSDRTKDITVFKNESVSYDTDTVKGGSTLDILSSTDFD
jgi:hypothetical protein